MKVDGREVIEQTCLDFLLAVVKDEARRKPEDFIYLARVTEWASDNPEAAYALLGEAREAGARVVGSPFLPCRVPPSLGPNEIGLVSRPERVPCRAMARGVLEPHCHHPTIPRFV